MKMSLLPNSGEETLQHLPLSFMALLYPGTKADGMIVYLLCSVVVMDRGGENFLQSDRRHFVAIILWQQSDLAKVAT